MVVRVGESDEKRGPGVFDGAESGIDGVQRVEDVHRRHHRVERVVGDVAREGDPVEGQPERTADRVHGQHLDLVDQFDRVAVRVGGDGDHTPGAAVDARVEDGFAGDDLVEIDRQRERAVDTQRHRLDGPDGGFEVRLAGQEHRLALEVGAAILADAAVDDQRPLDAVGLVEHRGKRLGVVALDLGIRSGGHGHRLRVEPIVDGIDDLVELQHRHDRAVDVHLGTERADTQQAGAALRACGIGGDLHGDGLTGLRRLGKHHLERVVRRVVAVVVVERHDPAVEEVAGLDDVGRARALEDHRQRHLVVRDVDDDGVDHVHIAAAARRQRQHRLVEALGQRVVVTEHVDRLVLVPRVGRGVVVGEGQLVDPLELDALFDREEQLRVAEGVHRVESDDHVGRRLLGQGHAHRVDEGEAVVVVEGVGLGIHEAVHLLGLERRGLALRLAQVDGLGVVPDDLDQRGRQHHSLVAQDLDPAGLVERLDPRVGDGERVGVVGDHQPRLADAGPGDDLDGRATQQVDFIGILEDR